MGRRTTLQCWFCYHSSERQWQPPSLGNNDADSCTGAKHQLSTEDHRFPGSRDGMCMTPNNLSSLVPKNELLSHLLPGERTIKISFTVKEVKCKRREHACTLMPVAGV